MSLPSVRAANCDEPGCGLVSGIRARPAYSRVGVVAPSLDPDESYSKTATTSSPNREREVLQVIAEGRSNKQVATMLVIDLTTVETHRAHILQRLNTHGVPELILYAVRKDIVT